MTLILLSGIAGCSYESPPCVVAAGAQRAESGNAVCVVEDAGRVLLVQHRRGRAWGLPGGRRGRGETSQCTAHRETWEEAGTFVEVGPLIGRTPGTQIYSCVLAAEAPDSTNWGQSLISRFEIVDVRWVTVEDLRDLEWRYEEQLPEVERSLRTSAD